MRSENRRSLLGSERDPLAGARRVCPAAPQERCEVSVVCRRPDDAAFSRHLAMATEAAGTAVAGPPAGDRSAVDSAALAAPPLSREDYAARFAADPQDLERVRRFANQHQLQVVREDACARTLQLSGTVAQMNAAFAVSLHRYVHGGVRYRAHVGPVLLPEELDGVVVAVLGLDSRPQARAHLRRPAAAGTPPAATGPRPFTPLELARLYDFPTGDGAGQCIGVIELGGGYDANDLRTYFTELGVPAPQVIEIGVDGARNQPSDDPDSADGEVMLDIEVAGALAPRARIAAYFAPNTDAGFLDALNQAVHDRIQRPSVISISWGSPEAYWSTQALRAFDDALAAAAALGVTVCVAAGDSGSSDGIADGAGHVDFPASSPYSLACGGTRLVANGTLIHSETVWNDGPDSASGGGVSSVFALPAWQKGLSVRYRNGRRAALATRGVPDVAGVGDPDTGYRVIVHGEHVVIGGTSAVAPLWAGLIARINAQAARPLGCLGPKIYRHGRVCNDVSQGDNGSFAATTGWNACAGFGSPDGRRVAGLT
ncbi:MAG: S53 family peptidase [Janthinobacterium lividum]